MCPMATKYTMISLMPRDILAIILSIIVSKSAFSTLVMRFLAFEVL